MGLIMPFILLFHISDLFFQTKVKMYVLQCGQQKISTTILK